MRWISVVLLAAGVIALQARRIPSRDQDERAIGGIEEYALVHGENIPGMGRGVSVFDEDEYIHAMGLTREAISDINPLDPPLLVLFTSATEHTKYKFKDAVKMLKNPKFDNQKKTVIYIHGFLEGLFAESVKTVVNSYAARKDHNIVILDWHAQAAPEYFLHAVKNVFKVGADLGAVVVDMINSGLSLQRLHIVGHSLGGQMAGVLGRTVQKVSSGAILLPRISALDPAFPGFYGFPGAEHLTANDAEYVDVLHTDAGIYGAPVDTGTVDFWPNGGLDPQPGCLINVCSHQRSWWYWIESLEENAPNYFNSVIAKSWKDFKLGKVGQFDPDIVMGYSVPDGLTGSYYLQTNKRLPFARGAAGVVYE